jgi:phosphoglycerate dehydrogenase-like enzyme
MAKIVATNSSDLTAAQRRRLTQLGDVTFYDNFTESADEYIDRIKGADIVCSGTAGLKQAYSRLGNVYITLPFVSAAFLDFSVLKKNGVQLSNAPGVNKEAVSEWIVWMMLSIAREFTDFLNSTKNYRKNGNLPHLTAGLSDKNVTILGNGNIGKTVAGIVEKLDMQVTVFKKGDDLFECIKNADYVVDVLSTNQTTRGLLDAKFFEEMKEGASFITVTREEIVDYDSLISNLDSEHLYFAAADCGGALVGDTSDALYKRLKNHPRIFATPHISYGSEKSISAGNDVMIDNVEQWIAGKPQNLLT